MPPTFSEPLDVDREALTRRPGGRPVMRQCWDHLLFLHWEVPAAAIARLLPPGLEVDTFEGRAYVGLVPFAMRGVRPAGLPSVRGLSNFRETNVRTYVHAGGREPGVWFFSLDAANAAAVAIARSWFRLPYFYSRMTLAAEEGERGLRVAYGSRRLYPDPRPATTRIVAEVGGPSFGAEVGTLDYFLAERYLLYARGRAGLLKGRVHHAPYPLQAAEALVVEESALAAAGIERPEAAPIARYARGVVVDVFGLERVEGAPIRRTGGSA